MTPQDFCHWLDGYLAGAEKPDAEVIKAKAREIAPVNTGLTWPPPQTVPHIVKTAPTYFPYVGDSTDPVWPNGTIICGQTQ